MDAEKVYLSAKNKVGVVELSQFISKVIFKEYLECKMLIPYDQGKIVNYFNENAYVKSTSYHDDGTLLTIECRESDYRRYEQFVFIEEY